MIGTISAGVGIVSGIAGMFGGGKDNSAQIGALHTKTHYLVVRRR